MYKSIILVFALSLGACSTVTKFTVEDLQTAKLKAIAFGDDAGAACWTALGKGFAAAPGRAKGLASAVEDLRGVRIALETACAPLAGDFLINGAHSLSGPASILLP